MYDLKSIRIRPLARSDGDQLRALTGTRDGVGPKEIERRARIVEWIAFHNPHAVRETTYFIAEHDGKMVAHLGRMPVHLLVHGEVARAYFAHDLLVHPEVRQQGLGYGLSVSLYREIETHSDGVFCMLGMTPVNLRIQKRLGYRELGFGRFTKFLDSRALSSYLPAPVRLPLFRSLFSAIVRSVDAITYRLSSGPGHIIEIHKFDKRFDEFMSRVAPKLGVCPLKTSDYLNWKYVDGPFARRVLFALETDNDIGGFVVLTVTRGTDGATGVILDVMADPDDTRAISALCTAAVRFFRGEGVGSVSCQLTDPRYIRVFRRHFFLQARSRPVMTVANIARLPDQEQVLTNVENWHIVLGDSDGFAFGV